MKCKTRYLALFSLLIGASVGAAPQSTVSALPTATELLTKWRTAVHAPAGASHQAVEAISNSNAEGILTETRELITANGEYRAITNRPFDTSEVLLTPAFGSRRDLNGFVRTLEGRELARFRSSILESQSIFLGPPTDMPNAVVSEDSSHLYYLLRVPTPAEDTLTWYINRTTGLPDKSIRSGDDTQISTSYEGWKMSDGIMTPDSGIVTETDRPVYNWKRVSYRVRDNVTDSEFTPLSPGPSDTRFDGPAQPIPFNFENDHIIFEVSLNGRKPRLFLLDTGADQEVINQNHLEEFGLDAYGKSTTEGGGGSADYSYARNATFTLPGIEIRNQHVALMDLSGLEKAYGMYIGGILGYDFISRFVVDIDYDHKLITMSNPTAWSYTGNGIILPVVIQDGIPYAGATISVPTRDAIPAYMLLDFGAAETMTLTSPFVKANDLLTLASTNPSVNHMAGLENQFFTQTNVRGHISCLVLGNLKIDSFPVNLSVNAKGAYASTSFSGTIGEGIFQRYHSILDYTRNRIVFEPTAESAKPYPGRMSYGMTLLASGDDLHTYTVVGLRPDSPATTDGFKKGDVITELDRKPAAQFTLGQLRESLTHDGQHHTFAVLRDSQTVVLEVDVRRVSIEQK